MNVQQVKGEVGDGEDDITTESLTKYEKACWDLGVALKEVKDGALQLRDPMVVLEELATAVSKEAEGSIKTANLINAVGGKYRGNQLSALLRNWETYEKMLSEFNSEDAIGSAFEESMKSAENWEGRLNSLSNTGTKFINNFVNSEMMTTGIKMLTDLLELLNLFVEKVGALPTLLSAVGAGLGAKNIGFFQTINTETGNKLVTVFKARQEAQREAEEQLANDVKCLKKYQKACDSGDFSTKTFTNTMGEASLQAQEYAKNIQNGTGSAENYEKAQVQMANATQKTSVATKLLNTGLNMLVNVGISMFISLAINGLYKLANAEKEAAEKAEEARKKAVELAEEYEREQQSLKDLQTRYTELIVSTNDVSTIKNELSDIQDEIIEKYNLEADALDVVNGKYAENIRLMQEERKQNAEDYITKNQADYDTAKDKLSKSHDVRYGLYGDKRSVNVTDLLELTAEGFGKWSNDTLDAWSKLEHFVDPRKFGFNKNFAYVGGTLEEQYQTLMAMADLYKQQDGYHKDRYQLLIDEANKLDEKIKDNKDLIDQYEKEKAYLDDINSISEDDKNNFYDLVDQAISLNNTIQNGDTTEAVVATYKLEHVRNELDNLAQDSTELQGVIDEVFSAFEKGATNTSDSLSGVNEQFSKQFEEKSKPTLENISKIEEAMQAISEGENVDFDTMWEINELDTEGIISSIDEVNGVYKMSIDELIALKNSLANGESEYWEAQKQDAQNAIQEIKKLKAIAEARLNAKKLEIGFIDSASEAEMLAEELEEIASYNSQIAEYENIIKDCTLSITEFNRHLGDTIDYTKTIESFTEQADELLEAQENAIDDIVDNLNAEKDILESQKDALDSQLEVLEEQQEAIEAIIDNYEQVADIASDAIQDEIDTLEENKQSIEDYYDEMIKKLQDANDERQEAIDLAEKQAALENAKKNKVRTFDESRGWVYEIDKEAYDNAQNDLLDAQAEAEISRLEKEKEKAVEGYDVQIEAFEKYAEKWKDVADGTTEAEEESLASQILGADWREKIKEQDIDILHNYQTQFNNYKTQLHNLTNGEIADLKRSIEAKQKEIDAKEDQIESWEDYKTEIQRLASDMKKTWDTYATDLYNITLTEKSNYEDRLANFKEFRNKYQSISNNIIKLNKKMSESQATPATVEPSIGQGGMLDGLMGISNSLNSAFSNSFFDIFKEISSLFDRISAVFSGEGYSSGGTNQTTGFAMLHGTKSSSETIFNATDSKKLYNLIHNTSNLSSMLADKISDNLKLGNKSINKNAQVVNHNNYDFKFGNIISDNPQNFMKFLQDYLRNLSSESNVF